MVESENIQETSLESLQKRIEVLFELKKYELLIELTKTALSIKPDDSLTLYYLGRTYHRLARYTEALEIVGTLLEMEPEDPDYHGAYGDTLASLDRHQEALVHIKKAIQLNPHNHRHYVSLAHSASLLTDPEQQDRVMPLMHKAAELNPNNPFIHGFLAILLGNRGLYQEAEKQFQTAIQIAPDLSINHSSYGNLLYYMGNLEEARRYTDQALQLNPMDPNAHVNLPLIEEADADPKMYDLKRIHTYLPITERYPQHDEPYRLLAKLFLDSNDMENAREALRAYLEVHPDGIDEEIQQWIDQAGFVPQTKKRWPKKSVALFFILLVVCAIFFLMK